MSWSSLTSFTISLSVLLRVLLGSVCWWMMRNSAVIGFRELKVFVILSPFAL